MVLVHVPKKMMLEGGEEVGYGFLCGRWECNKGCIKENDKIHRFNALFSAITLMPNISLPLVSIMHFILKSVHRSRRRRFTCNVAKSLQSSVESCLVVAASVVCSTACPRTGTSIGVITQCFSSAIVIRALKLSGPELLK